MKKKLWKKYALVLMVTIGLTTAAAGAASAAPTSTTTVTAVTTAATEKEAASQLEVRFGDRGTGLSCFTGMQK